MVTHVVPVVTRYESYFFTAIRGRVRTRPQEVFFSFEVVLFHPLTTLSCKVNVFRKAFISRLSQDRTLDDLQVYHSIYI